MLPEALQPVNVTRVWIATLDLCGYAYRVAGPQCVSAGTWIFMCTAPWRFVRTYEMNVALFGLFDEGTAINKMYNLFGCR